MNTVCGCGKFATKPITIKSQAIGQQPKLRAVNICRHCFNHMRFSITTNLIATRQQLAAPLKQHKEQL